MIVRNLNCKKGWMNKWQCGIFFQRVICFSFNLELWVRLFNINTVDSHNFLKRQKEKYLNSLILWGRINLSDFNNSVIFFICKLKWNIGCRECRQLNKRTRQGTIEFVSAAVFAYIVILSSVLTITEELSRLPGAQSLNSALALCSPQRWREGEQQIFFKC